MSPAKNTPSQAQPVALVAVMRKLIILASRLLKNPTVKLQHGVATPAAQAPSLPHEDVSGSALPVLAA